MGSKTNSKKLSGKLDIRKLFWFIFTAFWSFLIISPLYLMVKRSFENGGLNNYVKVFVSQNLLVYFKNSVVVTVATVIIVSCLTSLAAFAFSKLKFRFKDALYYTIIICMMIPSAAIVVPTFSAIKTIGLINNPLSLIGPYVTLFVPFNLLMSKNYMDNLPNELLESAYVDGQSLFGMFIHIILPLSKSNLVVVLIWTFMNSWNEFLLPQVFLRKEEAMTLTIIPMKLQGEYFADRSGLFAACTVIILPILFIYIFLQRYFEQGFISGAIKG